MAMAAERVPAQDSGPAKGRQLGCQPTDRKDGRVGVTTVEELKEGIELARNLGRVGRDLSAKTIPQLLPSIVFQVDGQGCKPTLHGR
jgi:hypothetical protein